MSKQKIASFRLEAQIPNMLVCLQNNKKRLKRCSLVSKGVEGKTCKQPLRYVDLEITSLPGGSLESEQHLQPFAMFNELE